MTAATAFPLCWPSGWPREAFRAHHSHAAFRNAPFGQSRDRLGAELERMRAREVILSTNLELNLSGQPRANLRTPNDPGVAVYFTLRGKAMVMARDCYPTVGQNVRSLALAIEHLRGLERHGGATMLERAFTGFAALPDPSAKASWREVLRIEPGALEAMAPVLRFAFVRQAYLRRAQYSHPDAGGSNEAMAEVNEAWEQAQREVPAP